MTRKTLQSIHEDDWRNRKSDYAVLRKDRDVLERMELLVEFIKRLRPGKVLDIGCGSGYLGHLIKKINSNIAFTGFDISEYAIGLAQSYDRVYLLDIDKEDIPENSGHFDMVVCADVLEHIYDVDHCLNEIKRVLKPDGKAVITTPNFSYWKYRIICVLGGIPNILKDPRHIRTFNHDFLSNKCHGEDFGVAYSIKEKKNFLTKMLETIFNKTVILILTKKNYGKNQSNS